jgi:hypothetical protein
VASRKSLWAPYVVLIFSLRPGQRAATLAGV